MGQAGDGGERGANLVAHVGQEASLGQAGTFGACLGLRQVGRAFGHQVFEMLAVALQLVLEQHALGYIAGNAEGADDAALAIAERPLGDMKGLAAGRRVELFKKGFDDALGDDPSIGGEQFFRLLPGENRQVVAADHRLRGFADEVAGGLVEHQIAPVHILGKDGVGRTVGHRFNQLQGVDLFGERGGIAAPVAVEQEIEQQGGHCHEGPALEHADADHLVRVGGDEQHGLVGEQDPGSRKGGIDQHDLDDAVPSVLKWGLAGH